MNKKLLNSRFYQILTLVVILIVVLAIRLFVLTVIQHNEWVEQAEGQNTKHITTSAPRGEILDRYGRVIATNKQIFNLTYNVSGLKTEEINSDIYNMISILERNGDEYVDKFPIKIEDGKFIYTYDQSLSKWLEKNEFPQDFTPEQALNAIRIQYEIDTSLDRYDAIEILNDKYGVWPPINARSMTYTYEIQKAQFLKKYGLKEGLNAEEAFAELRKLFKIDSSLSDEEARKILCIREEIKNLGYNKYLSCTVAKDISNETVINVEELSDKIKGAEVISESVRYYPNGSTLSHVLGYMGSISDSQYEEYVTEKGYKATDLIGKDGLEAALESTLKGKDGVKSIRVNSVGDYIEVLNETEPEAGKNVYLTVDLELQKIAEESLVKAIQATRTGTVFESKYGNVRLTRYEKCESGAVVALDVETGDVLAMASYPDYDPNIFASGISTEDWASVQSTNPRDSLAPTPLYNIATKATVQPGSTFKPVTAVAALQCGLDPDKGFTDRGGINIGGRTFGCYDWNYYGSTHGWQDLATGIQNSCNYYFYCIATGQIWPSGESLGYDEEITIEKIMEVAKELGLGEKTGIELGETITPLASAERKMQSMKNSLWYYLYGNAVRYWPQSVVDDVDKLKEEINTIVSWTEENPGRGEVIDRVDKQTSVMDDMVETVADICKYSFFNQATWSIGDEFNIAIGQGDNSYTPLQMARYVATLGNFGLRNQVSIIKGIEGEASKEKETYQIDVTEKEIQSVLKGMRRVATNGTLAGVFRNFPIEVAGKTGTAEKDGYINPEDEVSYVKRYLSAIAPGVSWSDVEAEMKKLMKDDPKTYPTENDAVDKAVIEASGKKVTTSDISRFKDTYDSFAWTVSLAPADDPKIAVVVMLVQGGTSGNAAPVAREVIAGYLLNENQYDPAEIKTQMQ